MTIAIFNRLTRICRKVVTKFFVFRNPYHRIHHIVQIVGQKSIHPIFDHVLDFAQIPGHHGQTGGRDEPRKKATFTYFLKQWTPRNQP